MSCTVRYSTGHEGNSGTCAGMAAREDWRSCGASEDEQDTEPDSVAHGRVVIQSSGQTMFSTAVVFDEIHYSYHLEDTGLDSILSKNHYMYMLMPCRQDGSPATIS